MIPKGVIRDIVTSYLPHWNDARVWVLARPLSGFAETFSHYLVDVAPGGGSKSPEPDMEAQGALFVVGGKLTLSLNGTEHVLRPGGFAYLPPAGRWSVQIAAPKRCNSTGFGSCISACLGTQTPEAIVTDQETIAPTPMPHTEGRWAATRFVDPSDIRHDHGHYHRHFRARRVNSVRGDPRHGARSLFWRAGRLSAQSRLGRGRGWGTTCGSALFVPQACYAGGPGRFRYLLYKDVNRHMDLRALRPATAYEIGLVGERDDRV